MNYTHNMITGNLTKDIELKERTIAATGEKMMVADFTVASNFERRNGEKGVTYYKVSLWGKEAENAANTLKKGTLVKVRGTLVPETWTGRDGIQRTNLVFHGRTLVDAWDRQAKAWSAVTLKAESPAGIKAEAPAGINAEILPFDVA